MKRLIIFASGRGSNARAIVDFFRKEGGADISLIVSNKADAGVLDMARREGIPALTATGKQLSDPDFLSQMQEHEPALIVLAGFLLKLPPQFIQAFKGKIVNIHPALLPRHGGKGMWGHHVHGAVLAAGDERSGITVHLVDEEYDRGPALLQATCPVVPGDDADRLATRVLKLEHFWYPRAIQALLLFADAEVAVP